MQLECSWYAMTHHGVFLTIDPGIPVMQRILLRIHSSHSQFHIKAALRQVQPGDHLP